MGLSVVMISANFHPYIGGAEKQALEVSKALKSRGVQVLVLTRRLKGLSSYEEVEGIPVRRLAAWGKGLLSSLIFMASSLVYLLLHRNEYQVLHAHLASSPSIVAAFVGKIFAKRVVVKLGGGSGYGEIARSRQNLLGKLKLRSLDLLKPVLVAVNQNQIKELQGTGLEKLEAHLIPNGVNLKEYHPATPEEKERLRKELGWSGLVFLFAGRFASDKRQSEVLKTFLQGWSRAFQEEFRGSFYLAGEGPEEKAFKDLILQTGTADSAHLLGSRQEVRELYRAADVFVLPTISEGLSNALLEAMASGLPVLASRVSGTMEIVQEGVHGFLFDPFRPEEVSGHLTAMAKNPARLQEMGRRARDWAASKFSLEKAVDSLMRTYR